LAEKEATVGEEEPSPFPGQGSSVEKNRQSPVLPKETEMKVDSLVKFLKEFNEKEEGRLFDASVFPCNVCFAEKLGSNSIRFPGELDRFL
jgi:hypothetical protein